jgi:PAS domain-containing protein
MPADEMPPTCHRLRPGGRPDALRLRSLNPSNRALFDIAPATTYNTHLFSRGETPYMGETDVVSENKTLWELLWDYDPNGLLVVDTGLMVRVVNPALCRMFKKGPDIVIGKSVSLLVDDPEDFLEVWEENRPVKAREKAYPAHELYVRKVMFPIRDQGIIACIMVDLTQEWRQKNDFLQLRQETVQRVSQVINNQMRVAHEIASLLGETTAESKVSLLKLMEMVERDRV